MKFYQQWVGCFDDGTKKSDWFAASVPGNIQKDFADAHHYDDINYGCNAGQYKWMEDVSWLYRTELDYQAKEGERIFFVSEGIDYAFQIYLNGSSIHAQEGMYTKVELDLTDKLEQGNTLEVLILPVPKREGATEDNRTQADQCCKPPASYGWDWHPRVIPSGIWDDTYIETRTHAFIRSCEPAYKLSEDYASADVTFEVDCGGDFTIELTDQSGAVVYSGADTSFTLNGINLWWCHDQGEPYLYRWRVYSCDDEKTGYLGFKHIELVMNEGGWGYYEHFPMSRNKPPMTLKLNGREIFAKGTNWVNPEIFTGTMTEGTYRPLIELAKAAHMNIIRCWGGAVVNKSCFYALCDQYGIMVWQDFPLACNNYLGTDKYLAILEQEASSIIKRLRRFACIVLWCGGNELFSFWAWMTDQALPLRLLDKLCYELDRNTPFITNSPVSGAAHGGYVFYDPRLQVDVFAQMQGAKNTAYTEFGVPGMPDVDYLKEIIPQDELFPIKLGGAWEMHHAVGAWGDKRWVCADILEMYFGKAETLEQLVAQTQWLQCEGYKAIFEEARRQKPSCSMAINWCYCEPWKTAANNSLISYPVIPKAAYYAVADALRPVMASARIPKFSWDTYETFTAELWLLNDTPKEVQDTVRAWLQIGAESIFLMEWSTGAVSANRNKTGHRIQLELPPVKTDRFTLVLESAIGGISRYTLHLRQVEPKLK